MTESNETREAIQRSDAVMRSVETLHARRMVRQLREEVERQLYGPDAVSERGETT